MEKLSCKVFDGKGAEVGSLSLSPTVFGAEVLPDLVHATVRWQRAKARAGTHSTLTRTMMAGGGKKPFKQKGTGRARAGSINSPVWVGGAVVHGPHPRSYEFRFPKRVRKQALLAALTDKVASGKLLVIEDVGTSGKTTDFVKTLDNLGLGSSSVLMLITGSGSESEVKTVRAARNIARVEVLPIAGLNVYSILKSESLICSKEVIAQIEKIVDQKK